MRIATGRSRASRASGQRWGRRMFQRPSSATAGLPPGIEPRRRLPYLAVGLPSASLRDMRRDPGALRRIFGDDALVDFLFLEEKDPDDRFAWVRRARARGGFVREFRDILTRMEAWR